MSNNSFNFINNLHLLLEALGFNTAEQQHASHTISVKLSGQLFLVLASCYGLICHLLILPTQRTVRH